MTTTSQFKPQSQPITSQAIIPVIIEAIIAQLEVDLVTQTRAAKDAHEAATHSESKAESKYDTFGLESAYLAQGQQSRVEQIEKDLRYFHYLDPDKQKPSLVIGEMSCITLVAEEDEQQLMFFLADQSGGLKVKLANVPITVITPESPLGAILVDKMVDDSVNIMIKGVNKTFEIIKLD
jgi:transcription elongation GreA/GreB family factor